MAYLQILSPGQATGRRLEFESDEITLGRAADNRLVLDDAAASSHHCVVIRSGSKYSMRDLGSTNGTLVNGLPVKECRLAPGDVITVGAAEILVDGDDIEVDASSRPEGGGTPITKTVVLGRAGSTTPAAFGQKKSKRGLWIAVGVVVGTMVGALIAWFLGRLFGAF